MADKQDILGTFEALLLSAILQLDPEAYGNPIHDALTAMTRGSISLGAIYTTADRLESKGYIVSETRSLGSGRPGRARRYMRLTGQGLAALKLYDDVQARRSRSWSTAPEGAIA